MSSKLRLNPFWASWHSTLSAGFQMEDVRTQTDPDGPGRHVRTRTECTDPDGPGRTRTDPDGPDGPGRTRTDGRTDGRTGGADGADRYLHQIQNRGSDLGFAPNSLSEQLLGAVDDCSGSSDPRCVCAMRPLIPKYEMLPPSNDSHRTPKHGAFTTASLTDRVRQSG